MESEHQGVAAHLIDDLLSFLEEHLGETALVAAAGKMGSVGDLMTHLEAHLPAVHLGRVQQLLDLKL